MMLNKIYRSSFQNGADEAPNTKNQKGQIILEYVLLLLIGLMVGNILVKQLTAFSDEPDNRGVIIKRWIQIWDAIGKDLPDQ